MPPIQTLHAVSQEEGRTRELLMFNTPRSVRAREIVRHDGGRLWLVERYDADLCQWLRRAACADAAAVFEQVERLGAGG